MGDVFKEQIVKRQSTIKDTAIRVCLWILVAVLGFAASTYLGPQLGLLVLFGAGFGAFFLMSFLNVEYEYIFTNGELDIDVIYNQSRRKRLFTAHVKSFEIMAHIDDTNHDSTFKSAQETRDYSSGVPGKNTYAFLAIYEGKKVTVIFEPNEKILKSISGVINPRKLHKKGE